MALDMALLHHVQGSPNAVWRMYGWHKPSFSFGYSQPWKEIMKSIPSRETDWVRRPTGGGLVDHRNDWTVALAIGSAHDAFRTPALDLYRRFHECEAAALAEVGVPVSLAPCPGPCESRPPIPGPGICFARPEPYDLMVPETGAKVAGAAMKRNKEGILIQASIEKSALKGIDREAFSAVLAPRLASWLGLDSCSRVHLKPPEEWSRRFASTAWNQKR